MASSYTSLLGLVLPVTGELSGTWGTVWNDSGTSLIDSSIAGTTTLSTDADVTLSTTNGVANQARQAILLCTGARTALRTITAPAQSKIYAVINSTTGGYGVKLVGVGPTTGVTIANGKAALVAWDGSDFHVIATDDASKISGILAPANGGTGVNNGSSTITIGGNVTMSGAYTFTGTLTNNTSVTFPTSGTLVNTGVTSLSSLATVGTLTGGTWNATTIGVAYGGTGQTSYTDGQLLIGNTTGNTLTKATLTQGTGITITNGSGSITIDNASPMTYPGAGIPNSTGSAWGTSYTTSGSGTVLALATSPSFTTPSLGVATATTINKVTFTQPATGSTLTIADGKTLTANNSITLSGTDSTTMTFPSSSATLAGLAIAQTFTATQTFYQDIYSNNAVTVSSNAGTVPVTYKLNTFTNSSAATMTITMATASAVDGQMSIVRIYDASAVAQTINWVNTENSTVTVPTTSNGSTTLPLTVGFMYNGQTSKWRCIASA